MADESKLQVLERKIAVARRELNKIRSDVNSMKKMFIQKFKEVKELSVQGRISENIKSGFHLVHHFRTFSAFSCLRELNVSLRIISTTTAFQITDIGNLDVGESKNPPKLEISEKSWMKVLLDLRAIPFNIHTPPPPDGRDFLRGP